MPEPHPALMVFAAGFGTRMGALVAHRPKPMLPVAGRPLLDHALALASAAGIGRVVVNTHYRAAAIAAHLANRPEVRIAHEPEILETGGGLKAALPALGGAAVLTLNADAVFTGRNPLAALAAAWPGAAAGGAEALLLLVPAARARGHGGAGDFALAADGRLTRAGPFVYTGAQAIAAAPVAAHPGRAFSLNAVWDGLIARGTAFGLLHPGGWCDVGTPAGLAAAEALIAGGGEYG
ncbi:MAG: NTP transferase domain-containing protein [Rhodobacteraceae bacterium]|nr:NTP transferase domain-containing protein [Paracoccaceae bacterium]